MASKNSLSKVSGINFQNINLDKFEIGLNVIDNPSLIINPPDEIIRKILFIINTNHIIYNKIMTKANITNDDVVRIKNTGQEIAILNV